MGLIVGLDIETTGLEWKEGHKIIEVALSIRDSDTGNSLKEIVKRFNPRRSIAEAAYKVHKIKLEDLTTAPLFEEFCEPLINVLKRSELIVAHNGKGFDIPFIAHELKECGFEMPDVPLLDTMLEGRWATEDGKMPSLRELAFACGYTYDIERAHGALYDTNLMMDCFFYAKQKYGLFNTPS